MHAVQTLSLLALAGSALAAPQGWGNWGKGYWGGHRHESSSPEAATPAATEVAVVTAYTTVTWSGWSMPTAAPAAPYVPEAPAPAPAPAPSAAPSAPTTNDGSYISIVEEWRSRMGMSSLAEDSTLQANALKTAQDGNGDMVHELNPGSMAQVLAPGPPTDFENVFVGGWLCEIPSLPGLNGVCSSMSSGWAYNGETGHADILTSQSYSKIGCACANNIWACDLA